MIKVVWYLNLFMHSVKQSESINLIFVLVIFKGKGSQSPAAALCTFKSLKSSNSTRSGIPPSSLDIWPKCSRWWYNTGYWIWNHAKKQTNLTRVLMLLFSWARLVIASAARLITPNTALEFWPSLCLFNRSTRWGRAPASTIICWCSGCTNKQKIEQTTWETRSMVMTVWT